MNNLLNIKSFLKFLSRNKGYTAIDIFGLSVSLMFVILIAVYVERELNIDKQQANYDRIVAVGNEDFLESAVPVSYWLEERYPEIEKVCPVITDQGEGMQVFYGDKKLKAGVIFADSTFFDIFSFKLLDGDRSRLLEDPYGAVVSESFARKGVRQRRSDREELAHQRLDECHGYRCHGRHQPFGDSECGPVGAYRADGGVQPVIVEDESG